MFKKIKERFSKRKKLAKRQPEILRYEELEQRVLFSADVVPGLDTAAVEEQVIVQDVDSDVQKEREAAAEAEEQTAAETRFELVLVNENVSDYEQLIDDLKSSDKHRVFEVVVLESNRDGIDQVSEIFAERSDLAAVHVISHGADGQINLGDSWLNSATLQQNRDAIAGWSSAFAETGDILIYGCNLTQTEVGQKLINDLSTLTMAEVAASDDPTGSTNLGGDWDLEFQAGQIETDVFVSADAQRQWSGLLAETIHVSHEETPNRDAAIKSTENAGQTFSYTSGNGNYDTNQIEVQLSKDSGVASQNITLYLRESWDGPNLASATISSDVLSTTASWETFNFSNVTLNDGQTYFIRLTSDGIDGKVRAYYENSVGGYANGDRIDKGVAKPGEDLPFRVVESTGDEVLLGTAGADVLAGTTGNDVLVGGGGSDQMLGEAGEDVFRFTGAQNGDVYTVDGGSESDTIDLSEFGSGTVADDGATITVDLGDSKSFTINYSNVENVVTADTAGNHAADADAGRDQPYALENTTVTLDGSRSGDFDGDALTYEWTQVGGPSVTLSDAGAAQPTFTSPSVSSPTTLTFSLTVSDGTTSHVDLVEITVLSTTTGTSGNDTLTGTSDSEALASSSGHDTIDGGAGDDRLAGGAGDDILIGGDGRDVANYSGQTGSITLDLTVTTAQNTTSAGTDTLTGIEGVIGGLGDDTYSFSNPQDSATYYVDGGAGNNTIDLSGFASSAITFGDGTVTVDMGSGQSFTIEYEVVDSIVFSDLTATVLGADVSTTAFSGTALYIDGGEAFKLDMSGGGTINWSYDRGSDTLSITSASGVGASSTLAITDLNGTDLRVDQITLDADFGDLTTNTGVGSISLAGAGSDLHGTFTIGGDLGSITMDQLNGTLDVLGDAGTITLSGSVLSGEQLTVTGDVGTLSVGGEMDGSVSIDGSVDTVDVTGQMGGGAVLSVGGNAGYIHVAQDIVSSASVSITGNVTTFAADDRILGSVDIGGDVGTFDLTGLKDGTSDLTSGSSVTIGGDVTTLTIQGTIKADVLPLLTIDGSVGTMTVSGNVLSDVNIGGDLDSASMNSVDPAAVFTASAVVGTLVFDVGGTDYGDSYGSATVFVYDGGIGSATATPWILGTPGDDSLAGSAGDDYIDALAGDDVITAGSGDDLIIGGAGQDTVDYSSAGAGVTVDLTIATAQDTGGGGVDTLQGIETVIGSSHDDTFAFSAAQNGAIYTVNGGAGGTDTIDLTGYNISDAVFADGKVTIDTGAGLSLEVNYSNIDSVQFGDVTATVMNGDFSEIGFSGSATYIEGDAAFTIEHVGGGSSDWSYVSATNSLSISDTNGTSASSSINITSHEGSNLTLDSFASDGVTGSLTTNVDIGQITFMANSDDNTINNITVKNGSGTINSITYLGDSGIIGTTTIDANVGTFAMGGDVDSGIFIISGDVRTVDVTNFVGGTVIAERVIGQFDSIADNPYSNNFATVTKVTLDGSTSIEAGVNTAPTVVNLIADQEATEGTAFSFQFAANTFADADGDTLTYTSDAAGWLSFDAATRTFSGTPLNGDAGTSTFTLTADDGFGGTVSETFDIVVTHGNDAPVFTGANDLTSINEDDFANGGTLVSDLISGQISDTDSGSVEGIAVIAVDDANGAWEYTTDGGSNWTAFGAVDGSTARLLAADANTSVRFVPDANWNGTVTNGITFHAWDQTSGTAGGTADLASTVTVRDEFTSGNGFTGDDGAVSWAGAWQQIGETDGANAGTVTADGTPEALAIGGDDSVDIGGDGVQRQVNLSAATSATLTLDAWRSTDTDNSEVSLLVSADGSNWIELEEFDMTNTPDSATGYSYDISAYASATTWIRFEGLGTTDAGETNYLYFDNVQIAYQTAANIGGNTAFSSNSASSSISVNSVPINNLPATQSTTEDTAITFNSANGNLISITGNAGDNLAVTLSVTNGTLTLSQITGLTFDAGANGSATMTLTGTVENINAALDGLQYTPTSNYTGGDTLTLVSTETQTYALDTDANLSGYYTFEGGNANDQSPGGANDATLVGDATITTDVDRGEVLSLDGSADSALISGLFGNPANVTLSAWVNLTTADTLGADVLSLGDNLTLRLDDTFDGPPTLRGSYYDGSQWNNLEFETTLAGAGWNHVSFVFDDTNNSATLYLNGAAVNTATVTASISYSQGSNTFIGAHGNGGTEYDFNGLIDDVRAYTRALSTEEIATLAAGSLLSDTDTVDITVTPVNDAPVLDDSGFLTLTTITEDDTGNNGNLISEIIASDGGDRITDVDVGALEGIAIFNLSSGNGTWEYNIGSGWNPVGTVSVNSSLLLGATNRIRFVPDGLNSDLGIITFAAWDQTSGAAGAKVDTSVFGATTAFSDATETAVINVTAVNDAPTFSTTNSTPTFTENGGAVSLFSGTSVDPVEAGDLIDTLRITVDSLADGSDEILVIDGQDVELTHLNNETTATSGYDVSISVSGTTATVLITKTGGFSSAAAETLINGLAYNNTSENPQGAVRMVNLISIKDDGGTANGGDDSTGIGISSLVTISAVNDDPTNTGSLPIDLVFLEDMQGKLNLSAIDLSDVDAGSGDLTLTITSANGHLQTLGWPGLTLVSTQTSLELTGNLTDLNDFLNDTNSIDYEHATPNMSGNNVDLITIEITDNGNTGSGGGGTITLGTINIDVTAANDAPTAGNNTVTTNENTTYTFSASDFNFSDIDGDTLASVKITSLVTVGSLQLSGGDVALNQIISKADIDAGNLTFTPIPGENGAGYDSFQFSVNDGMVDSAASYTMTIDVTAANNAPTFIDGSIGNWNFDEGSGDSIVESAIGISTGTLGSAAGADANDPTWTTGKFGQALHFDGVEDYVEIADAPGIDISGSEFSASLWVKPDRGPDQEDMFFMKGDRQGIGNVNYYLSWKDTNKMTWAFKSDGGFEYLDIDVTLPTVGEWNHIAVVFNRPTVSLYINGTEYTFNNVATGGTSMDKDLVANDEPLWIGAGRDGGDIVTPGNYSAPFSGAIDEFAIFDRALTGAEIEAIRTSTPPAVTASAFSIDENSADNTVVGTVVANDQDIGDTLSYAITAGNTGGAFSIDANGQIKVANSTALDFETNPTFNLIIEATDDGSPNLSDTMTVTITLANVNDAPTAASNTVTTNEDTTYTFTAADFNFGDVDGDTLASVKITSLESVGSLQLSGGDVALNQVISKAEIDAGNLTFTPIPGENGAGYDSFQFSVNDGTVDSAASYIMTIDVTAVNNPPTVDLNGSDGGGTDFTTTFTEDGGAVSVTDSDAIISDADDTFFQYLGINLFNMSDGASEKVVVAGYTFTYGTSDIVTRTVGSTDFEIDFDGTGFSIAEDAGGNMPLADLQLLMRGITYENLSQNPTSGDRNLEFTAQDAPGLLSPIATSTITVNALNDAPVVTATGGSTAYTEQAAAKVIDAGLTLIDPDGFDGADPSDQYTAVIQITGNYEAADTLGFTNTSNIQGVLAGDMLTLSVIGGQTATIADFQAALRTVTFYNGSDTPSELNRTISFSFDDGVDSSNLSTKTVQVTAVNDTPTTVGIADITVDEDAADTVVDLFAAFADVEDLDPALTYTITNNTNPGLFTATTIDGGAGSLTLDYAADQNGAADITVRATDTGGQFVETTFTVTVNAVNDTPTTVGIADVTVAEDAADSVVDLFAAFADVEDLDPTLTYSITNNTNPGLFTSTTIDGGAGSLTLNYAADQNGAADITVRATDTGGQFVETTFTVTVNAVNDTPTTSGIADITVDEDAADSVVDLFAAFADVEDLDPALTYSITNNTNPGLFSSTNIGGVAGSLTLDYAAAQNGSADITVRATDTGGQFVETTFTVTVNAVNDTPTTSGIADVTVDEDAADTVVDLFAAFADVEDLDPTLTYTITNNTNPGLFTSTTIDGVAGSLTLDYAADQNGCSRYHRSGHRYRRSVCRDHFYGDGQPGQRYTHHRGHCRCHGG